MPPRRPLTGTRAPDGARLRVLLALTLIVVAQVIALYHFTGHAVRGDNASCVICIGASSAGNGVPAGSMLAGINSLADWPAVPVITGQQYRSPQPTHRPRAPPAFT